MRMHTMPLPDFECTGSKLHAIYIVRSYVFHLKCHVDKPPDIHILLEAEEFMNRGHNRYIELFSIPRNRRAALASFIVMFMQQFCGVNVIAYYSTQIFREAGFSITNAFLASFGFGASKHKLLCSDAKSLISYHIVNFLFALPAVKTIDTFGRRNLLLTTFPLMSVFLLMTGFSFWIPGGGSGQLAVVALGIYLYGMVYSPGEGPVPFTVRILFYISKISRR